MVQGKEAIANLFISHRDQHFKWHAGSAKEMDDKKREIKEKYQKRLDKEIGGLEVFSQDHRESTEKFNRLLETLQKSQKSRTERIALVELKQLIDNLLKYMESNNITLRDSERKELTIITGSGFDPLAKKRMAEDLVHKIRKRCAREKELSSERKKSEKEIKQLVDSKKSFCSWFHLTKFSLDYGSITLLSHRFLDKNLSLIRININNWLGNVETSVSEIMDSKYYILSNLEYNAIQKLLSLRPVVNKIIKVKQELSYDPGRISEIMNEFAAIYIAVIKNSEVIEAAIKKIMRKIEKTHGLWGDLKSLLDEPIINNRSVKWNPQSRMTESILGMLLSYYTSRYGAVVTTLNQLMYLADTDGTIESGQKILTPKAEKIEKEVRSKKESEKKYREVRFKSLGKIVKQYLDNGRKFEDMILQSDAKNRYKMWIEEHKKNPLLKIKRLVEGFIKYFIESINDVPAFKLHYDKNEFLNYFSQRESLTKLTAKYTMDGFELVGSKLRDFTSQSLVTGNDSERFIKTVVETEKPKISGLNFVRKVLLDIGNQSYSIANALNEIIINYYRNKEIVDDKIMNNYNFYIDAQLQRSRQNKSPVLFKKESISLKTFMESACSFAFHIAREVQHPGITAILTEKEKLEETLKDEKMAAAMGEEELAGEGEIGVDSDIDREENVAESLYTDTLTGLKRKNYLDDVILQRSYDKKGRYTGELKRFIFICEIFSLVNFNDRYSHDTGDKIVFSVARAFYDKVNAPGTHKDNIIIRYSGAELVGFIHEVTLTGAVDILGQVVKNIISIQVDHEGEDIGQIPVAAAVYEERKNSAYLDNFSTVSRILTSVARKGTGTVGFIKKSEYIVTKRDFDMSGILDDDLLGVIK